MSELPFEQPSPDLPIVYRSSAQGYAECPARERYRDEGHITAVGELAESGEEVHQAIARVIEAMLEPEGPRSRGDIVDALRSEILTARTDLLPDAVNAIERSYWKLADLFGNTHFEDIICYDGGRGKRSSQLAIDFTNIKPHFRFSSEIDFLRSTASPSVLEEWDWKTGHKFHTEASIINDFQFQSHWLLVSETFKQRESGEPLEALDVRVMNTRHGKATWNVRFTRDMLPAIRARVQAAGSEAMRWRGVAAEEAETRPTREKCRICDAAAICRVADSDVRQLVTDPGAFLETTLAIQERVDARKELMAGWVEKSGTDIVSAEGNAFGFDKPPSNRKPSKSFYETTDA